jgi:hypothetical protein
MHSLKSVLEIDIDGMLVASITSHKVRPNSGLVDIVDSLASLDPSIIFVALQDIYPTRIAIVVIGQWKAK